ncbi:hypothetical protein [Leifsonia sp. 71-9]|uniref:hypothetical protein n=1 Tax=Leifsonia sp. 71-9 TaxID=1895934 RepID=UPI000926F436|nr:hypothetical protein [Leifsonia sp. 71-9]OJX76733.1 MAG: hypothetical protein BGO91_00940 [Leifsonia sp. 71-9]
MEMGDASGATRPRPRGALGLFLAYGGVVATLAVGPAIMCVGLVAGADWWIPMLVGAALSVFVIPFALAKWRMIGRQQREAALLGERGRLARGEVVAIGPAMFADEDGVTLTLRFADLDVPAFQVEYVCAAARGYEVGDRIEALVDPETGLFAIPSERQRRALRGTLS